MSSTLDPLVKARMQIHTETVIRAKKSVRKAFLTRYRDDFPAFMRDMVSWPPDGGPTSYQLEIADALMQYSRVAVVGPHGLGKGLCASLLMWWGIATLDGVTDWKTGVTAGGFRQLTHFLWPEFRKWGRAIRWDLIGRPPPDPRNEMLRLTFRGVSGEAFAAAATNPELLEGAHASQIIYILDEAKALPDANFDSIEGAFSGAGSGGRKAYALTLSTPGDASGRFYDICTHGTELTAYDATTRSFTTRQQPGEQGIAYGEWKVRRVTFEETVRAGRNNEAWGEARKLQWGAASAMYVNRVLGQFIRNRTDGTIPLSWIEAAMERWDEAGILSPTPDGVRTIRHGSLSALGVDVGGGTDLGVIAPRYGLWIGRLHYEPDADPTTMGEIASTMLEDTNAPAVVDAIGVGAGVVSELRKQGRRVIPFVASERAEETDSTGIMSFVNLRAYAWWHLRELLDPKHEEQVALPPDDRLAADLSAPRWWATNSGKIQLESKDDLRGRTGRSPDAGDAVVMAFYDGIDSRSGPDLRGVSVINFTRPSPWGIA